MMKMQTYKVNFQPVGTFYFGNERTLGPDNADYFASSNYLPQQTTILGVIRYRLLEMRGWLKDHNGYTAGKKDDIDALIGPKSFCGNPPEKSSEFGVLKSLSPLFIEQDGVLLLPGALNRHYSLKSLSGQETSSTQGLWTSLCGGEKTGLPELKGYDYKNPVEGHCIGAGLTEPLKPEDIFQYDTRVGITKKKEGEPDDKAFYKQSKLRFKNADTSFLCYVTLQEKEGEELMEYVSQNPHVPMGGERSVFYMSMEKGGIDEAIFDIYLSNSDLNQSQHQIIFLSNAKVSPTVYDSCRFAITQTTDFRHINTSNQTKNHYEKPDKSGAYQLLKAGSVLYPDGENTIEENLTKEVRAFRQIGYNAFIEIKDGTVSTNLYQYQNE